MVQAVYIYIMYLLVICLLASYYGIIAIVVYSQVSVYLQNWSHVVSYVNKAETTPFLLEVNVILCSLDFIRSQRSNF